MSQFCRPRSIDMPRESTPEDTAGPLVSSTVRRRLVPPKGFDGPACANSDVAPMARVAATRVSTNATLLALDFTASSVGSEFLAGADNHPQTRRACHRVPVPTHGHIVFTVIWLCDSDPPWVKAPNPRRLAGFCEWACYL